jgi:hypothetical protein
MEEVMEIHEELFLKHYVACAEEESLRYFYTNLGFIEMGYGDMSTCFKTLEF